MKIRMPEACVTITIFLFVYQGMCFMLVWFTLYRLCVHASVDRNTVCWYVHIVWGCLIGCYVLIWLVHSEPTSKYLLREPGLPFTDEILVNLTANIQARSYINLNHRIHVAPVDSLLKKILNLKLRHSLTGLCLVNVR